MPPARQLVHCQQGVSEPVSARSLEIIENPGQMFAVSFYISNAFDNPALGELEVVVNGQSLGTVQAPTQTGTWVQSQLFMLSTSSDTALEIDLIDEATGSGGSDHGLDDIPLHLKQSVVPVPGARALMLVGLGAPGAARLRRRS